MGQAWSQDRGSSQPASSSYVASTQPQATVPASEGAGHRADAIPQAQGLQAESSQKRWFPRVCVWRGGHPTEGDLNRHEGTKVGVGVENTDADG